MDNQDVQKKCEMFLEELDVPGIIFFGWKKPDKQFGFVYSYRKFPRDIAIKGLLWALQKVIDTPKTKGSND